MKKSSKNSNKIEVSMPFWDALHQWLHCLHEFLVLKIKWYRSWHNNRLAHRLHLAVLFLAFGLILTAIVQSASVTHSTSLDFEAIYEKTNAIRQEFRKRSLRLDPILTRVAQEKAEDILKRDYFSHTDPGGKMIWGKVQEAGYDYLYLGENLAKGYNNADDLVAAWLSSPSHRENLLSDNFVDLGIGMAWGEYQGKDNVFVVVQLFGIRKTDKPL